MPLADLLCPFRARTKMRNIKKRKRGGKAEPPRVLPASVVAASTAQSVKSSAGRMIHAQRRFVNLTIIFGA
jgi:hypothetical protein